MHIAQLNVATALYDLDDPRMAEFVARLDDVNVLADRSDGFVWRLQSEAGSAVDIKAADDPRLLVNMSVWRDVDALFAFVYRTAHREVMVKRRSWFERPDGPFQVLWWVQEGHVPTVEEGLQRLETLRRHGPAPDAFTFKSVYPPQSGEATDLQPEPHCVGWS
jgi:hypothetical protein